MRTARKSRCAQSGWEDARERRPATAAAHATPPLVPGRVSTQRQDDTGMTWEAQMRTALELAANGPAAGVNPRVGCVIVGPAGDTIAEGWHRGVGTPHAEVDALSRLPEGGARG